MRAAAGDVVAGLEVVVVVVEAGELAVVVVALLVDLVVVAGEGDVFAEVWA